MGEHDMNPPQTTDNSDVMPLPVNDDALSLRILMLLPFRYRPGMCIVPQIGVINHLAQMGHQVSWIVWSDTNSSSPEDPSDGVKILARRYRLYLKGNSPLSKSFNLVCNSLGRIRHVLRIFASKQYNMIVVRSHIIDGLIAAYLCRKHHIPLVIQLRNPLDQEWAIYKIERKRPQLGYYLLAKLKYYVIRRLLSRADLVMPISESLERDLIERGCNPSRLMALPEAVSSSFCCTDGAGLSIRKRYCTDDERLVVYVGSIDKARGLEILVSAWSELKKGKTRVKLLMIGAGSGEQYLRKRVESLDLSKEIFFLGERPHAEIPNIIAAADLCVSPIPPLSFYRLSSPIKIFEYMAIGKPVVANHEIPEQKNVIEASGGGMLVAYQPEAFARAISELIDNPPKAVEMGLRGRDWVIKNRSYETLARRVEQKCLGLTAFARA